MLDNSAQREDLLIVRSPIECLECREMYDGARWDDCPACRISALETVVRACVDAWDTDEGMTEACELGRILLSRGT